MKKQTSYGHSKGNGGQSRAQGIADIGAHRKGIVEELEKAHIYISQLEKIVKTKNFRNTLGIRSW